MRSVRAFKRLVCPTLFKKDWSDACWASRPVGIKYHDAPEDVLVLTTVNSSDRRNPPYTLGILGVKQELGSVEFEIVGGPETGDKGGDYFKSQWLNPPGGGMRTPVEADWRTLGGCRRSRAPTAACTW